jgi:tetratricopeptide (TPR) repeat protein
MWFVSLTDVARSTSTEATVPNITITVRVFNFAQVSTDTWSVAQKVATQVFDRAAIQTVWLDCSLTAEGHYAVPDCEHTPDSTELVLRLVPISAATLTQFGDGTLGIAAQPEKGTPASASVFSDRVKELAKGGGTSIEVILGHAVAHEIGHLLLGSNSHSSMGLMRSKWSRQDLVQAAGGELQFTQGEVARIRDGLLKPKPKVTARVYNYARVTQKVLAGAGLTAPEMVSGDVEAKDGQNEKAYLLALAEAEKVGPGDPRVARCLNVLALFYQNRGRLAEAESLYGRALRIQESRAGTDPEVTVTLNNLAQLLTTLGRYSEAKPLYHRALSIKKDYLGPGHREVATVENNLAKVYRMEGRLHEAAVLFLQAISTLEKIPGPESLELAMILNNLGSVYQDQHHQSEAVTMYQQALRIQEETVGKNHLDVAMTANNLATLFFERKRYDQAEPLYMRALDIRETILGKSHPDVAAILNNLGQLYFRQHRYGDAESSYRRALDICETSLGPSHPDLAETLNAYAVLLKKKKRKAEAKEMMARASEITKRADRSVNRTVDIRDLDNQRQTLKE